MASVTIIKECLRFIQIECPALFNLFSDSPPPRSLPMRRNETIITVQPAFTMIGDTEWEMVEEPNSTTSEKEE